MTYLVLNEKHYCTDSHHSDEQYGSWWTEYDFEEPTEAYSIPKPSYRGVGYIGPELTPGDILYVLYVLYSSGDSFGNSNRGNYEVLCVNKDPDKAAANLDMVRRVKNHGSVDLQTDNGKTQSLYCGGWTGYFESVDQIELAEVLYMGAEQ